MPAAAAAVFLRNANSVPLLVCSLASSMANYYNLTIVSKYTIGALLQMTLAYY